MLSREELSGEKKKQAGMHSFYIAEGRTPQTSPSDKVFSSTIVTSFFIVLMHFFKNGTVVKKVNTLQDTSVL